MFWRSLTHLLSLSNSLLFPGCRYCQYDCTPKYLSQTQVISLNSRSLYPNSLLTLRCLKFVIHIVLPKFSSSRWVTTLPFLRPVIFESAWISLFTTLPIGSITIPFTSHQHLPRITPVFPWPTATECILSHCHHSSWFLFSKWFPCFDPCPLGHSHPWNIDTLPEGVTLNLKPWR